MPKVPAMRMVWTPYKNALGEVLAGRSEPGTQLLAVEREVKGYLKR
jgi:maltose-binding protein MalE